MLTPSYGDKKLQCSRTWEKRLTLNTGEVTRGLDPYHPFQLESLLHDHSQSQLAPSGGYCWIYFKNESICVSV